ncbi:hypothetical protein [Cytobacillus firmus]|uniref:Uncharacterized protein n=1 Tax=Cytobacillus firmus DS1 TaxID=1307436 RepID=W7LC57_CYTFI|nr:hypothetical protein [Cytobacillus firmus]EWG12757.1 hypothetical protein PBF_04440 [Cytobacillus firmus DS1]
MPEINLPTKATQDFIKEKTDLIGSSNPTTADTTTLMNYLKRLEEKIDAGGGGTDWSKYMNTLSTISYDVNNNTNWVTLMNRTGKGYVKALYSSCIGYSFNIRVTVDGVVLMTYRSVNGNIASGMATKDFISVGGNNYDGDRAWLIGDQPSNKTSIMMSTALLNLPIQDLDTEFFSLLSQPIFYNESLKIEAKLHSSRPNGNNARSSVYFFGGIGI